MTRFFHATSWGGKSIHSFSQRADDGATWSENLVRQRNKPLSSNRWGSHVMVDDCERRWLSTSRLTGLLIYNSEGQYLDGTFSIHTWNGTFDAMFLDNYVLLLSDLNCRNKITRLDPRIKC